MNEQNMMPVTICSRRDYHQVDEQDPYLPPSAASQAIAARTLRGQGSYPPTAPSLNPNAHGTHNTIKQPLLLTPPPPSYATATARARQLHESMLKFVHETFLCFFLLYILVLLSNGIFQVKYPKTFTETTSVRLNIFA